MLLNKYSETVHVQYGNLQSLLDWVRRNAAGEWGWEVVEPSDACDGIYRFHFEEAEDLTKFTLWYK